MSVIDWIILLFTLFFIVLYGTWKTKLNRSIKSYILGDNTSNWWTVGLSVMATQASAITFLSTPGQAYNDGMGFLQFYFGLPLAMVIICMVFIPLYHKLKVYSAYEFLENRFNGKVRTFTAILFLIQRGLAAGITIYAPSIILSAVLGWDLKVLNILIGVLVIIYTVSGGTKAVSITQKQQMFVIMLGMFFVFFMIIGLFPNTFNFSDALHLSAANGKLNILDFSFDTSKRYTFWSGITGGLFLALSYFGTDQSQVQRYLSGKSIKESQLGLIFNGLLKIPMQFFILLTGVMVFVLFQFQKTPLHFNPTAIETLKSSDYKADYQKLEYAYNTNFVDKKNAALTSNLTLNSLANQKEKEIRSKVKTLLKKADKTIEQNDKDYVFIYFILNYLPKGLIGLLLAVILSAAMSSTASELNALGTVSVIDLYKRNVKNKSESHYVSISKLLTLIWGCIAILFANFGTLVENLIQLVNIVGSIFYGNILGIFLTAFFISYIRGKSMLYAAIITQLFILFLFTYSTYSTTFEISYLLLNFIGCITVIIIAYLLQFFLPKTLSK